MQSGRIQLNKRQSDENIFHVLDAKRAAKATTKKLRVERERVMEIPGE